MKIPSQIVSFIKKSIPLIMFVFVVFLFVPKMSFAAGEFITTWKTDNPGISGSNQISIPVVLSETYNYNIDWGDGTTDTGVTISNFHTYASPGTYTVKITGTFPRIYFNGSGGSDAQKLLSIEQWGTNHWTSMYAAFSGCSNLVINATDAPDLSGVTDTNAMFKNATSLNQNINSWDVSHVMNMGFMFYGATSFNQPLNLWNTPSVTDTDNMFNGALSFDQNIGAWDVSHVTNMTNMFTNVFLSLASYDGILAGWSAQSLQPNVHFDAGISYYCSATAQRNILTGAPNNWTITDAGLNCTIPTPFITTWKTDNPGSSNSDQITIPTYPGEIYNYKVNWGDGTNSLGMTGDITHTYTSPGTYTVSITGVFPRIYFNNDTNDAAKILSVEQWGTNPWTSMNSAFAGCSNLVVNAIDTPNLSGVTDIAGMFQNASSFNQLINSWDVSHVTNMSLLFFGASSFNQPLNSWDVSHVLYMPAMFAQDSVFNQPLNNWNTSSVVAMQYMFASSGTSAFNQDISSWNTSNVTDMHGMFQLSTAFNQPLDTWDTLSVTDTSFMFYGASSFNKDISTWNTSHVANMSGMFANATSFNQPLASWDVSNVTDMSFMFAYAVSFAQDISAWDTSHVADMSGIFTGISRTLTYIAGTGGTVSGTTQVVDDGTDGEPVTATPNFGYSFSKWSDDVTSNPRTDTTVIRNITVTAIFIPNPVTSIISSGSSGGSSYSAPTSNTFLHNISPEEHMVTPTIPNNISPTAAAPLVISVPALKPNTSSPDVKKLQKYLNTHGFPVALKGPGSLHSETVTFSEKTKAAVIKFQKAHKLKADGVVGPKTIAAMK